MLPGDSAIETALGQSDVMTSILRAIGAGDPKHACNTAKAWCSGKKALHAACEGDEGAWKHLADSVFPSATSVMQPRKPNGTDKDYAILHSIWKQEGGKGLPIRRWEYIIEKHKMYFNKRRTPTELLKLARDNGLVTARLREERPVLSPDPKHVFFKLCDIRYILQVIFECEIYKLVSNNYRKRLESGDFPFDGNHVAQAAELKELMEELDERERLALRTKYKLESNENENMKQYFKNIESPMKMATKFVKGHIKNIIVDDSPMKIAISFVKRHLLRVLGDNVSQEDFILKVPNEFKKEAIEAVVDVCVKKVLEYNEQDMFSGNPNDPLPDGVTKNLKSELDAPFVKVKQ